jgi:hypothetical protein
MCATGPDCRTNSETRRGDSTTHGREPTVEHLGNYREYGSFPLDHGPHFYPNMREITIVAEWECPCIR